MQATVQIYRPILILVQFMRALSPNVYALVKRCKHQHKCTEKLKGFRVTAETEEKVTHQSRVGLIKGFIDNIDIAYDQFTIKNSQIYTKQMIKQWSFQTFNLIRDVLLE